MITRSIKRISLRALIVDDELGTPTAEGRAARALVTEMQGRNIEVIEALSAEDGRAVITSDSAIHALLIDWSLGDDKNHARSRELIEYVRSRNDKIPIFLLAERGEAAAIPVDIMGKVDEFIWTLEDTAAFVGGRVSAAIRRYLEVMMPPLAAALMKFTLDFEYSWHTPGHQGGTAFLKSPVGRIFFDYFGENVLRSDLSISVGSLGSLLDHSGPMGEHERYCARVFGAHRSYSVTNGTSMSNRVIFMAAVARDQIALCDRNCHKSIEHSLVMTGGIPQYLVPLRNRYGIIGPIPPDRLSKAAIANGIKNNPLVTRGVNTRAVHSIVTNSTYDGLIYDARRVQELLDPSVDRIHFDEAWYAYARFNPIYKGRHAMHGDPKDHKGPTIFATHSTHKLLAALSQASLLHIRDGRSPIPHSRFNESYMLHASTSPLYPIIVSNDITAAMMDGPGGPALTGESIAEAVAFRQTMGRVHRQFAAKKQWFFKTWNAEFIKGKGGKKVRFEEASPGPARDGSGMLGAASERKLARLRRSRRRLLHARPDQGVDRHPGYRGQGRPREDWHPRDAGHGLPALHRGVEVEKTTDFTILVLFSIGITKGKWGTLLNALLDFKKDYDDNAPLEQVLPHLTNNHGATYGGMGLRDLADQMFEQLKVSKQTQCMAEAFSTLPEPKLSPNNAYQYLVRDEIEHVPLEELADRVLATSVVPYPPGIPMLMPGEATGADDGPYLGYLRALQNWDKRFPGFGHDTHGVENRDGTHFIQCLKRGWEKA